MNGLKQSVLSICQFIIQFVSQSSENNVCVPDRDQSSSLLCISSFFLLNIAIVHHCDMVHHLGTLETGICGLQAHVCVYHPARSQNCKKLGRVLGMRLHIHLIYCGQLSTRLPFE